MKLKLSARMLLSQIRRDHAVRSLTLWLINNGVTTSVLTGLLVFRAVGSRTQASPALLILALWCGFAIYLVFGKVRTRAGQLDLSLPLPARRIWLGHVLAVLLAGALNLLVSALVVVAHLQVLEHLVFETPIEPLSWALLLITGLLLVVALVECQSPHLATVPLRRPALLRRGLAVVAVGGLMAALSTLSLTWLLLPLLAAAIAIITFTYRSLPPSLTFESERPVPAAITDEQPSAIPARSARWRLPRYLFVTVHGAKWGPVTPWLTLPWIVLLGLAPSELGSMLDFDFRFLYLPLVSGMLINFACPAVEQLAHLDFLPIARRQLLGWVVVPVLLAMLAGYAGGTIAARLMTPARHIGYYESQRDGHYYLDVPVNQLRLSWNGTVPDINSPWGETRPAWTSPLYKGSDIVYYSPYHTPPGSSPELVALQISRAAAAVYGVELAPAEIRRRCLEVDDSGTVRPRGGQLQLRERFPELQLQSTVDGPLFPVLLALILVPATVMFVIYLRLFRAGFSSGKRRAVLVMMVLLSCLVPAVQMVAAIQRLVEPWTLWGMVEIGVRSLAGNPLASVLVWLASAALLYGCYRWVVAAFSRIELPVAPSFPALTRTD
jgi:hypothetical protein